MPCPREDTGLQRVRGPLRSTAEEGREGLVLSSGRGGAPGHSPTLRQAVWEPPPEPLRQPLQTRHLGRSECPPGTARTCACASPSVPAGWEGSREWHGTHTLGLVRMSR